MQAEYFPLKENVILQNESPTDLYILVSGAVDLKIYIEGTEQICGRAVAGDMFGEMGVLCYCAQPYTAQTIELSQILRLNKGTLKSLIRENQKDGEIIMSNLFQKLRLHKRLYPGLEPKDPRLVLKELFDGAPIKVNQCSCAQNTPFRHAGGAPTEEETLLCSTGGISEDDTINEVLRHLADPESTDVEKEGKTTHHSSFCNGNYEMVELQLRQGLDGDTGSRWEQQIDLMRKTNASGGMISDIMANSCPTRLSFDNGAAKMTKRVTIHLHSQKEIVERDQNAKLIILPNSLNELLKIGGEKFVGHIPTKVVNQENAEIEDISVVRDGDHLFLLEI